MIDMTQNICYQQFEMLYQRLAKKELGYICKSFFLLNKPNIGCKLQNSGTIKTVINIERCLNSRLKYYFGKIGKQIKQQSSPQLSATQRIFQQIDEFRNKQISNSDIQNISLKILASTMAINEKSSAIKYLMGVLYKKNYLGNELVNDSQIKRLLKGQPFLELQTIMHVITKEIGKEKPDFNFVNNLYLECFNKVLPSASGNEKLKCQVLLYKYFGKHVIDNKQISKGLSWLQKSVEKHRQLILEEYRKLQRYLKQHEKNIDGSPKTKSQKQRQQVTANAMRQNMRRLMQSMFESLYLYYNVKKNDLKDPNKTQKQKQEVVLQLAVLIRESMKLKAFVPGVELFSRYYHKLMQIFYELQFTYVLMRKDQNRAKEIKNQMKQFCKQCTYDIKQSKGHIQVQKQIVKALFSIKLHLIRMEKGKSDADIKQELSETAIQLFQINNLQQNSAERDIVTKFLNDFKKKNIK